MEPLSSRFVKRLPKPSRILRKRLGAARAFKRFSPLTPRLAYLVIGLAFLGLAALAAEIYISVRRELTDVLMARRAAIAQLAAATLSERINRIVDVGVSLATRVRFAELVSQGQWDAAMRILDAVPSQFPFVDRLVLYDVRGTLMADVPPERSLHGQNFAYRDWYQGVNRTGRPYVSEVFSTVVAPRREVFAVAVPIKDGVGAPAGILQLRVNLETFFDWAKAVDLGRNGEIRVVDGKGFAAFDSLAGGPAGLADLSTNPAVAQLLQGKSGVTIAAGRENGDYLYAFTPAQHGWGVVIAQPAAEVFATRENQLSRLLVGYALIAAFCAAIALLAAHLVRQRRDLDDLYNKAPCGYHSVDENGLIVRMNDTWLGWLGYTRDEVVGKLHHPDLMTPQSAKRFREHWFPLFKKQGWLKEVEVEYARKDGSTFPGLLQTSAVYGPDGRYLASRTTVFDISERRRMDNELRENNAFLDSVVENIPNMIFVKDAAELRFVRFNRAGEELLGYARGELIGKNDYDFFPTAEADFFTAKDREVLATGKLLEIDAEEIDTRFKGKRILRTKKIPISGADGGRKYLLGISEDITERKAADDRIRALNDELQTRAAQLAVLNKELESFSYSVSHDLRAPLRAVDGYARMLEEDYGTRFDDEGRRLLAVVRDSSRRMGRLIDDLLAFSRLGRQELTRRPLDMTALAREVVARLAGEAHANVRVAPLPRAQGDPALITQVWANLIGNALKYSGKRRDAYVEIGGSEAPGERRYWVRDNGVGFDMRYVAKLFGVFQRLHSEEQFPGTGVGLAIVQRVVARHGGRVWAEGKPGEGATFYFSLPEEATA